MFQSLGSLMLVLAKDDDEIISSMILFIVSLILTIYHGVGVITIVFFVKADKLQNLVVVDVNDMSETSSFTSNGSVQMSKFSKRSSSKAADNEAIHHNPLHNMKGLA
jgi:hypothetical protein